MIYEPERVFSAPSARTVVAISSSNSCFALEVPIDRGGLNVELYPEAANVNSSSPSWFSSFSPAFVTMSRLIFMNPEYKVRHLFIEQC